MQIDRKTIGCNIKIIKRYIADAGVTGAVFPQIAFRVLAQDRRTSAVKGNIAETAMADGIVAGTADPDALTWTVEYRVAYGNIFANELITAVPADGTQHQTIIAGFEKAVADRYIAAAVYIKTIVVHHTLIAFDADL